MNYFVVFVYFRISYKTSQRKRIQWIFNYDNHHFSGSKST
jgi:hypothetical protein